MAVSQRMGRFDQWYLRWAGNPGVNKGGSGKEAFCLDQVLHPGPKRRDQGDPHRRQTARKVEDHEEERNDLGHGLDLAPS